MSLSVGGARRRMEHAFGGVVADIAGCGSGGYYALQFDRESNAMANFQVERLKHLPQRAGDTWQGGFIRLPAWITEGRDRPSRAMTTMWGSLQTDTVGTGKGVYPRDKTTFAMAVGALVDFASGPCAGYRPGRLEVNDPALAEHLSGLLAEADIRVEHRQRLLMVERHVQDMTRSIFKGTPVPPGYLEGKGVTPERVRAFAGAAESFYEAAPWQHLSNDDLVEIESPRADAAFRFAVVLGAGGEEYGLGFYRSQDQYWNSRDLEDPIGALLAGGGVWSLTFDDVTSIPFPDADLWEDNDLPVAGDDAYPVAMRFEAPMRFRRPNADVLGFLEGLMSALTVSTQDEMDSGRWGKHVTTSNGPAEYVLSLPLLLNPPDHKQLFDHGLSDRRAMEAMHAQMDRFLADKDFDDIKELNQAIEKEFAGKPLDPTKHKPRTPLEEAQDLCFQAFDSIGRRRVALARKAIEVCPDCADAHVILAEGATTPEKAGEFYAAGVEAGKRALGEPFFRENAGQFWSVTSTRPFMRALSGLAEAQATIGQADKAIDNYQELLRLNPVDNQGVRYLLLPLLLTHQRHEEAEKLLADFKKDIMATWLYGRALLTFATEGDTPTARRQLTKAIATNGLVPPYLLGDAEIDHAPEAYSIGSDEEAIACAIESGSAWQAVPGALDWLRAQAAKPARKRRKPSARQKK